MTIQLVHPQPKLVQLYELKVGDHFVLDEKNPDQYYIKCNQNYKDPTLPDTSCLILSQRGKTHTYFPTDKLVFPVKVKSIKLEFEYKK